MNTDGLDAALAARNLQALTGRPVAEVLVGLAEYVCPTSGSVDDGVARYAFIEMLAEMAEAGFPDLAAFDPGQMFTIIESYAAHAVEARICNDIGAKVLAFPSTPQMAEHVQAEIHDFIRRAVTDALASVRDQILTIAPTRILGLVTGVYQAAFEILQCCPAAEAV